LFATGLCLPSGSSLSDAEQDEVIAGIRNVPRACADERTEGGLARV